MDSYERIGGQTNLTESGVQDEAMNSEYSSIATPDFAKLLKNRSLSPKQNIKLIVRTYRYTEIELLIRQLFHLNAT